MTSRLLTVQETADVLRCCKHHVYGLVKQGLLKAFRDSRRILVEEVSLSSYLHERAMSVGHCNLHGQDTTGA